MFNIYAKQESLTNVSIVGLVFCSATGMDKEAGDRRAGIHSTLSRVGSPPLVVMKSDKYK